MPTQTRHGKFEADPAYDEEKAISAEVEEARAYLERSLACIDRMENPTFRLICMFSLLDCLAQEQAGYPAGARNAKQAFCRFVLDHQKQCDYLECVEPVTLYYHVEDLIDETVWHPAFPPEKEISLGSLSGLYGEGVGSAGAKRKSQEILEYLEKKMGKDFAARKAEEHKMIALLYRMRSKAVHEMSGLGESRNFNKTLRPEVPYYRDVGRSYVQNEDWVSDEVIELVIPNAFIRRILADCIQGYLDDCIVNHRFPFGNNHMLRKPRLTWYDKD